jgi:hypothetical protein
MAENTLNQVSDLVELHNISPDILPRQLEACLQTARRRLIEWVGQAAYDDALLAGNAVNQARSDDLTLAEARLAMAFAITSLNANITPKGMVSEAREEGNRVIKYFGPAETLKYKQSFLDEAAEFARPYLLAAFDNAEERVGLVDFVTV